ncbi:hypothetical protein [Zoogloea sp.]|uniref:hypothetical protein n=1 Tax=Zoogloea sp. TaxID=49181 RepID=UPI001415A098|nr:MAG: hypothetical protein F9K15_01925 [Zoogloea sp.]
MKKHRLLIPVITASLLPAEAFGFGIVLHYQGDEGDREAYFADLRTISNRSSADQTMGPTEVREIDTTAVYESPDKPEFVHMKLQFECPAAFSMDKTTHELKKNNKRIRAGDTVTFRIGPGSYKLRRADLQPEPIPASNWKTSNGPMLSKAGTIACNHIEIDKALHAAIRGERFDFDGFGKRISQLGLPPDMMLTGQALPSEFLDFSWQFLWWEKYFAGERPDPSGKWSKRLSRADKEAGIRKLAEMREQAQPQVEAAKKSLMEGIRKGQAAMAARAHTAQRIDGKPLTPIESNLLTLWKGRPESEVVNTMGNPEFNQAGDSRYLRYTRYWEKPGLTSYGMNGHVIASEIGGYAECFVEFTTRQDSRGEWRVEDVLVRSDHEGAGLGRTKDLCQDVASAAAR